MRVSLAPCSESTGAGYFSGIAFHHGAAARLATQIAEARFPLMTALHLLNCASYRMKVDFSFHARLLMHKSISMDLTLALFAGIDDHGLVNISQETGFDAVTFIATFECLGDMGWSSMRIACSVG